MKFTNKSMLTVPAKSPAFCQNGQKGSKTPLFGMNFRPKEVFSGVFRGPVHSGIICQKVSKSGQKQSKVSLLDHFWTVASRQECTAGRAEGSRKEQK